MKMSKLLKAKWVRAALVLVAFAGMIAFFVWRGPDWGLVVDAFRFVAWQWVVAAIALNLLSVVARAGAWNQVIEQALPPPQPPFRAGLLRVRRRPVRERRSARPHRRARARRGSEPEDRGGAAGGHWATLLGTVFAARVFDLFPVLLLIGYVAATAKIPHWALASVVVFVIVAFALFGFALASAAAPPSLRARGRGRRRPPADHDGPLRARRSCTRRVPAVFAALLQCLGWLCQLFAVWASMRAFDIHAPLPAAGLVLLLMNVAMLFPLWPGNVGLVQAAVALPLVSYGVRLRQGLRVRDRAAGDRDVRRRRRRLDLPRPRGALVRDAASTCRAPSRRRSARRTTRTASRRPSKSRVNALASPASCKGVLSALEAAMALAAGMRGAGLEAEELPVADGGESTAEVLRGDARRRVADSRLLRIRSAVLVEARYLVLEDGSAVVEAAEAGGAAAARGRASSIRLRASSRGLGEAARWRSRGEASGPILVGLGDTATVDGGAGLLEVVGDAR